MEKKKKVRAALVLAALALMLILSACGQTPESVAQSDENAETSEMNENNGDNKNNNNPADVENNGGWFVRVDDKIYFRKYGPDALDKTAVFGEFLQSYHATGRDSEIMAYDLNTREVESVFKDTGYGKLYYADDGFYLQERINQKDIIVWYSMDGEIYKTIAEGRILGLSESGFLAVEAPVPGTGYRYEFYQDGTRTGEYLLASQFITCGVSDDGLFVLEISFSENGDTDEISTPIYKIWQVKTDGELISLGTLPETDFIYSVEPGDFITTANEIGIVIGYYAGTGHFLNDWIAITANPGAEGSLKILQSPLNEDSEDGEDSESGDSDIWENAEEGEMILPELDINNAGEIVLTAYKSGDLDLKWDNENDDYSGDLALYNGFDWEILKEDFYPVREYGYGYEKNIQSMEYIDGSVYMTLALVHASPVDDIGWRSAYELIDILYLEIPAAQGSERELAAVDCNSVFQGEVWFSEEQDFILWRQMNSDPDAYQYEAEYVYKIPVAQDAEWYAVDSGDNGGKAAILNDAVFINIDSLGEPDYYGYKAPEYAGQVLYFRLNRDGEIIYLTEKSPDALLYLEIGVEENDLNNAVKKLNITRRASDEDTPWYWARLTALEDGVNLVLDQTPENQNFIETLAGQDGFFMPDKILFSGILNRGESIGVRVSLPWHPEIRAYVTRNGTYGQYIFGEDNYSHDDPGDGKIKKINLAGYEFSQGEDNLSGWNGKWFYKDSLTGKHTAALALNTGEYGMANLETGTDNAYWFAFEPDRLYAEDWEPADLIKFYAESDETIEALNGMSGNVGDYRAEIFKTDGEMILNLIQANNGDAALDYFISSQKQWNTEFIFHQYTGAAENVAPLKNADLIAKIAKVDYQNNLIWLREAEIADESESGDMIYKIKYYAPCQSVSVKSPDTLDIFKKFENPDYPMAIFHVVTNRDGDILSLDEI